MNFSLNTPHAAEDPHRSVQQASHVELMNRLPAIPAAWQGFRQQSVHPVHQLISVLNPAGTNHLPSPIWEKVDGIHLLPFSESVSTGISVALTPALLTYQDISTVPARGSSHRYLFGFFFSPVSPPADGLAVPSCSAATAAPPPSVLSTF